MKPTPAIRTFARGLQSLAGVAVADGGRRLLLTGPSDPDGDSIGACLALARGLAALGCTDVVVSGTAGFRYGWLPGARQMVPDGEVSPDFDVVVVLDGDRHRLHPVVAAAFAAAEARVILDHHRSTQPKGYELALIVPEAASTCELVLAVLDCWNIELDADLAASLYTGVVFDTGGFRHANTTPDTHRTAARLLETGIDPSAISTRVLLERQRPGSLLLGRALSSARFEAKGEVCWAAISLSDLETVSGEYADIEGIVDQLLLTVGVELAVLFIERAPGRVKLSLRSRTRVDVSRLARYLDADGGGHRRAAGVELHQALDVVLQTVPPVLAQAARGELALAHSGLSHGE